MQKSIAVVLTFLFAIATAAVADEAPQAKVTMDENLWVVFYDVPSRRFRSIRADFVQRQFDTASTDLQTSASYLEIEAARAQPAIATRLNEVAARLTWIAENIRDSSVTGTELDSVFGRAHWLLAQHYLTMAKQSRDTQQNRNAGLYLWATTHHIERAVLWSNARIDRKVQQTLDDLRELATELQNEKLAKKAYSAKPINRAETLLRDLGTVIDRPVVAVL